MLDRDFCRRLNKATDDIAMAFLLNYFWDKEKNDFSGKVNWIEDSKNELHQNLFINDYYFSLDTIYTALWYHISKDELFQWYDHVQRSYME